MIQQTKLVPDENGLISLYTAEGCTEKYHGTFTGANVLVVGRGTESERLYVKGRMIDAMRFAKAKQLTLDRVAVTDLCHDAVVALLSA